MNTLAIDIGGTTTKIAIVNNRGEITKKFKPRKTHSGHCLKWLFTFVNQIQEPFTKIGICVPGFYDPIHRIIIKAGNLGYDNFHIGDECKKYTNTPITILNDANAAALGEFWKMSFNNPQIKNVVLYTIGTGIGGGIIIDKKLYEGSHGFAGELGHGGKFGNNAPCSCGLENCIEVFSSAVGITKKINEYALKDKNSKIGIKYIKKGSLLSIRDVVDLINLNDKVTIEAISEALEPLVNHISIMAYALNPQIFIIGGGFSNIGKNISKIFKNLLAKKVTPFMMETFDIVTAKYGNDAAFFGCAYKAFQNEG